MRQKQHARQLEGADRAALGFRVAAKSGARNIGLYGVRLDAARRLRRQRLAAAVNRLGERVAVLRVTGGDRFAPSLVRPIGGRTMTAPAITAPPVYGARLNRETFRTSRLLEFCSKKEPIAQTGHEVDDWPLVILKELVDHAIDACEEAGIAPDVVIKVSTTTGEIAVSDNGPGIPNDTIASLTDYSIWVSRREAYCSPARGARGNAFKTLLAMAFVLSGERGETVIEAQGLGHRIVFQFDHVRQEPRTSHEVSTASVRNGTAVRVRWLESTTTSSWAGALWLGCRPKSRIGSSSKLKRGAEPWPEVVAWAT